MARAGFGSYQSYTIQRKRREFFRKTLTILVTVYLSYLVLDGLVIKPFIVETDSMGPNIPTGSHVLTLPLAYEPRLPLIPWALPSFRSPNRGDIVLVRPPYIEEEFPLITFLKDLSRFLTFGIFVPFEESRQYPSLTLRRLVALPGDTLSLKGGIAYIKKQGEEFPLSEFEISEKLYDVMRNTIPPGWEGSDPFSGEKEEITLGDDQYWVLADTRGGEDSMVWGPVKRSNLKSLVWLTFWPFDRLKFH